MLRAAIGFFIIGLVAFALGAGGVGGLSIEIGRTLLFVFIAFAVLSFLVSLFTGKKPQIIWIPIFLFGLTFAPGTSNANAEDSPKTQFQNDIGDAKTDTKVHARKLKRYVRNKTGKQSRVKDSKDLIYDASDKTQNSIEKVERKAK